MDTTSLKTPLITPEDALQSPVQEKTGEGSSVSPQIKIAASRDEQAAAKRFIKGLESQVAKTDAAGNEISYRNQDIFTGGPMDNLVCEHQPNGPRAHNDPKGLYADYFFRDKMRVGDNWITGYHIYACSVSIYADQDGFVHPEMRSTFGFNLRGANFRKVYRYCGFLDEGFFTLKNQMTQYDFNGVLSVAY